jgi:Glycosyl hydrolase family 26
MVFNNASPDWHGWEDPWFLHDTEPGYDWSAWVSAPGTHRQLIVTQNLFPSALNGSDWLRQGAAGAFLGHARALARNLVAAGLGGSVIRLAHEANDTEAPYALGTGKRQLRLWRTFWRRTVIAMRSVPGAHFLFDWCVNAYWRPISLSEWYPGDDVVNIIGIDAYDSGVPVGDNRWTRVYTQPDGIRDVLQFAKAHGKPVSFPEWGLAPADAHSLGGGNDPTYIDGMAQVVRNNRVAYQAYFYAHDSAQLLADSARSLAAYRRHFGARGDSAGSPLITSG